MLRVGMPFAKPGMVLAMPVYQPRRPDTVLLAPGVVLDDQMIARLGENNLREVWIRYPGMDFLAEYINPEVFEAQAALTARVAEVFDTITAGAHARLDYPRYREAVVAMVNSLLAVPKAALFIQEIAETAQPGLAHSSNVCFLSILMGLKLEDYLVAQRARLMAWNARDVTSLGVGAMLHDVGMLRLEPETVERWRRTHDELDPRWRQHVLVGYEMVKGGIEPTAAAAILHHHQKFDGTGFPKRRTPTGGEERCAGQDIHIFARIIAAADLFDRIRSPEPPAGEPGRRIPTVCALRRLTSAPYRDWIDPMVFKALLAVAPAYAPGTLVELSNGAQGVVAEWFPQDPCRPTVVEVDLSRAAEPGWMPRRFVLRGQTAVTVVGAEGCDVRGENFYPAYPGEFDLNLADRRLVNSMAEHDGSLGRGRAA
jgi:HD-GYP domain-containing protein (c-di-GMP phosphodiesterase class II)